MQITHQNFGLRLARTNQIFCFQIKRAPWMAQFFPDCVIHVRFFCLTISHFFHVYLYQRARAILLVFEKFTRAYLFQIALESM